MCVPNGIIFLASINLLTTHVLLVRVEKDNLDVSIVPYEALTINSLLALLVMISSSLALSSITISLCLFVEE